MTKTLKIFIAYFKVGIIRHFYYRGTLIFDLLGKIISLSFTFFLWIKIYQGKEQIAGISLGSLLTYYLVAMFVRFLANPSIASIIGEKIKGGQVQMHLVRPGHPLISYLAMVGAKRIAECLAYTVLMVVTVIFVFPLFGFSVGILHLGWFFVFLLIAIIMAFMIGTLVGLSAFWVVNYSPLTYGLSPLTSILSGLMIPVAFFPSFFQNIINHLPFRFMASDPVLILQGKITGVDIYRSLGIAAIWILAIYISIQFIWKRGTKRFDAVGN